MIRIFLTCLLVLCALPVKAADFDYAAFARIPVLHEGRVKPMDSFARIHLKRFSDSEAIDDISAIAWLAEAMFEPTEAMKRAVFYIPNKALKRDIGLDAEQKYFSFLDLSRVLGGSEEQISALFQKDINSLSDAQRLFLDLHEKHVTYLQLIRSFSLFLPLDLVTDDSDDLTNIPPGANFVTLYKSQPELIDDLKKIVEEKGEDFEAYSNNEKGLAKLAYDMSVFQSAGAENFLLRIMPSSEEWISPWQVIFRGEGSVRQSQLMNVLTALVNAYRTGDAARFSQAAETFLDQPHAKAYKGAVGLEIFYNLIKPFGIALVLYVLAFGALVVYAGKRDKKLYWAAFGGLLLGAMFHLGGVVIRMIVLERPPVGTLYESLIFVALICVGFALGAALWSRFDRLRGVSLLLGSLSGAVLLFIAPYMISQGESMEMLVAVLNTNFWLITHVLMITAGYGFCLLTSLMAHGYLIARSRGSERRVFNIFEQGAYRLSIIALLLTSVGTALGGIWADQSWGRFWGWDPKENGALLIVLWLIWVQHGRISGALRARTSQALFAFLSVIVALAWFGVNLLSVGLHSYGFIDGIAYGLLGFISFEILLVGGLYIWIVRREQVSA